MKLKLLLALAGFIVGGGNLWAQTEWEDKTSLIVNPSFEQDDAISDLTNSANRKNPTGWTVTYDTGTTNNGTQQWGTANSSSQLYSKSGKGTSTPSAGDKFFHLRENWHGSTTYEIYQTIDAANVPAGVYRLTAKIATSASAATDYTLTIQEEGGTAVVAKQNTGNNAYNWQDWSVIVYKASSETSLTIKATMKGGSAKDSHWCMLVDDFHLYYADPATVTTSSTLDMTGAIMNPSFEWGNTNGWTAQGGSSDTGARLNSNVNYTTSGVDGDYVYNTWQSSSTLYKVYQKLTGLPDGYYQMTALIASDANQHIQVYCGNGKVYDTAADKGTGKTVTTAVAYISGGSVEIGATSYNWFKCDNFRLTYLGTDFTPSEETPLALTDKASLNWNVSGTTIQWGIQFREVYSKDPTTLANDVLTQTISGLDNGNYRVKLWAEASYAKNNGVADSDVAAGTHVATLYANDATKEVNLENQTGVAAGTLNSYTLDAQVTAHTLKIGMNAVAAGANWKIIQIENLLYTGPLDLSSYQSAYEALVSEAGTAKSTHTAVVGKELTDLNAALVESFDTTSPDAYDDINGRLRTLIDAFVAAAPNYALLATEKTKAAALGMTEEAITEAAPTTKTGLLALQDLKVAEYKYVTTNYAYGVALGEWTSTAINTSAADFNNEHWSGTTHNYKNQNDNNGQGWNATSWSISFNQDVTLPAGNYVFKVAGRQASDEHVTTSLVVKVGDEELGSISDFPRSNSSRGINKSGETSFNEDASKYANNGNGFGWEWRYVKFTLSENATVNIAVNSVATGSHCWVSFGDYTLQTDNEANISMIAYNIAKNSAITVRDNATYTNVQGTDRSNLLAAINADPGTTKTSIEAATTALDDARTTFTAGVASWNSYALAKGYADAITVAALPYATSAKIEAVTTAKDATVNTAADAETATAAINTANRAAYESNAIAENVTGAKDRTSVIVNADGSETTGWSGSFWTATAEAYTEANGNTTNTYFDKNGVKAFTTEQTVKLPKGTYLLSVTARAQQGIDSYQMKVTNNAGTETTINLSAIGNTNGVFNRGWNDYYLIFEQTEFGSATISIVADNTTADANFWMSWDRFRLFLIDGTDDNVVIAETDATAPSAISDVNVTLTRTLSSDYWNTFTSPVDISADEIKDVFGDGSMVREMDTESEVTDNVIKFKDATAITAGVPYLVKPAQTVVNPTFAGKKVVAAGQEVKNNDDYKFIGILTKTQLAAPTNDATALDLYLATNNTMKKPGSNGANIKGMRAYFNIPVAAAEAGVKLSLGEDVDAITVVDGEPVAGAAIYNLAGQRLQKMQKGVNIVGGRKVIVK